MRVAIDTNVLVYAEGVGDDSRCERANALMTRLVDGDIVLPVQVLGELYRVLTRKHGCTPDAARSAIVRWTDMHPAYESNWVALQGAFDLVAAHGLTIWDSLIFSVAAEQRCRVLLTEDLQPSFTWRGVTVVNPFVEPAHPLLTELLA
jgi:predicted nucleic acid-binding protein